ncbi:MAG: DUF3795 domain-containing protein [Candidatus Methanofastidiosia archaeon]
MPNKVFPAIGQYPRCQSWQHGHAGNTRNVIRNCGIKKQKEVRMKQEAKMIGVCGLDCNECDIFQALNKPEIARQIVDWFKKERDTEVKIEDVRCLGCKSDRTKHWSPNCWILECCVDKRGLEFCHQCGDFPCEKLNEWAKGSKKYGEDLNRLKEIKKSLQKKVNHNIFWKKTVWKGFSFQNFRIV